MLESLSLADRNAVADIPAPDLSFLAEFRADLESIGFLPLCANFRADAAFTAHVAKNLSQMPTELRAASLLLLFSQPVHAERLPTALQKHLDPLVELSLLRRVRGDIIIMEDVYVCFCERKALFLQRATTNSAAYFGDDTLGLSRRLRPRKGGSSLDVCAGPGTQAILCSDVAAHVTAVESNPIAIGVAQANLAMNEIDNVQYAWSKFAAWVPERTYDHVCMNPPLLPIPDNLPYPYVGDGGPTGLNITNQVIKRSPDYLNDGGTCQIVGTGLANEEGLIESANLVRLAKEAGLAGQLFFISQRSLLPGAFFFDGLAETVSIGSEIPYDVAQNKLGAFFQESGADRLGLFVIEAVRKSGTLEVIDFSKTNERGFWFVE